MKFYCEKCAKILNRDMRLEHVKTNVNSRGEYVSFCEEYGKRVACKPYSEYVKARRKNLKSKYKLKQIKKCIKANCQSQ